MKIIPSDVTESHGIFSDDCFITVIDPRHQNNSFHYTAWCKLDKRSILDLTLDDIPMLEKVRDKFCKYKHNEKFKTILHFPPSFWRLHLHFVALNHEIPKTTPKHEVYNLNDIIKNLKIDEDYYRKRVQILAKI